MPIAMTDGTTYENSLDMLFAKDMPSREETDRQQKMKDMDSTMPPDMRGPPSPPTPDEDHQLSEQPPKDQNDPNYWGMGPSMNRTGPAMVPLPAPKFHEIMNHMDYLIDPEGALPANARLTSAEIPAEQKPEPKSAYQNFTDKLEELSKSLNPSFIPTAEQFRDAPWKEKLGFIIASSFMFAGPGRGPKGSLPSGKSDPLSAWTEGLAEFDKANPPIIKTLEAAEKEGSKTAATLLGEYRKIDDPVVRAEFSKIVKDKIASASEGGETAPSDITNPTIRGMKEGSDWSEVIVKPDGTKETVYDTAKIERLRNLRDNGLTFTEIGEKMGVSRNSVNSMLRRLKKMDAEEMQPSEGKPYKPWSPTEDKVLKTWYNDPNSDLFTTPDLLAHRSETAINARIKQLGLEKAADKAASKPFVPKGALRAPETGGGSGGPVNTELEGKSGIKTPKGLNDPEFRSLQAMRKEPDNLNLNPSEYAGSTIRRIINDHVSLMDARGTSSKLTKEDINAIVDKHREGFKDFQKINPEENSASVFGRFLDRQIAVERELASIERQRMDKYDVEVMARQNRKEIKSVKKKPSED